MNTSSNVIEIWKPVKNYLNIYEISSFGRLRSLDRVVTNTLGIRTKVKGVMLNPSLTHDGYLYSSLYKKGVGLSFRIHRLVADAFIPNPKNKPEVNHIDANKINNRLENLEWSTRIENINHSIENELQDFCKGEEVGSSKLKTEDVIYIRRNYKKGNGRDLAKKFDVNGSCISKIVNRFSWKHI